MADSGYLHVVESGTVGASQVDNKEALAAAFVGAYQQAMKKMKASRLDVYCLRVTVEMWGEVNG